MARKTTERAARKVCELRGLPADQPVDDGSGRLQWEAQKEATDQILRILDKDSVAERLYERADPIARPVKAVGQMAIGMGIAVLITGKAAGEVIGFGSSEVLEDFSWLNNVPTLKIVGSGLSYAAGIELAYMLYTAGPDEAIEPLILALSGAAMIEASRDASTQTIAAVAVFSIVIAFLFRLRDKYFGDA